MAKKKAPATRGAGATVPSAGAFSLGTGGLQGLGGGGFSLDGKAPNRGPITAPLPDLSKRPPGEPLPIEVEDRAELDELQAQFADKKLSAAEFYEKKRKEQARRSQATEISYWVGLVFANTADLEIFLKQLPPGIEWVGQWADGYQFAEEMGYNVPRTNLTDPSGNVLEQWAELALEVPAPPEPGVPAGFDPHFE